MLDPDNEGSTVWCVNADWSDGAAVISRIPLEDDITTFGTPVDAWEATTVLLVGSLA